MEERCSVFLRSRSQTLFSHVIHQLFYFLISALSLKFDQSFFHVAWPELLGLNALIPVSMRE